MILRSPSLAIWLRVDSPPLRSLQASQWLEGREGLASVADKYLRGIDGFGGKRKEGSL